MDFSEALKAIKRGGTVCRSGWNGKRMWIALVAQDQWGIGSRVPYDGGRVGAHFHSWIGMRTADNGFVPWLASQTDILATDWEFFSEADEFRQYVDNDDEKSFMPPPSVPMLNLNRY